MRKHIWILVAVLLLVPAMAQAVQSLEDARIAKSESVGQVETQAPAQEYVAPQAPSVPQYYGSAEQKQLDELLKEFNNFKKSQKAFNKKTAKDLTAYETTLGGRVKSLEVGAENVALLINGDEEHNGLANDVRDLNGTVYGDGTVKNPGLVPVVYGTKKYPGLLGKMNKLWLTIFGDGTKKQPGVEKRLNGVEKRLSGIEKTVAEIENSCFVQYATAILVGVAVFVILVGFLFGIVFIYYQKKPPK